MRYDARRFKKLLRSFSAQASRRDKGSRLSNAHIVERFTRRFWMLSGLHSPR